MDNSPGTQSALKAAHLYNSDHTDRNELIKLVTAEDPDVIMIFPPEKEGLKPKFNIMKYVEAGNKIRGSTLGDAYDIILFRVSPLGATKDKERFEAILIQPMIYILRMYDLGYYLLCARLTDNSDNYVTNVYTALD